MSKEVVLCVSNAYQKKYYLNENFNGLPQTIRDEAKSRALGIQRMWRHTGAGV